MRNKMANLVGLGFQKRSGKDTVADILVENFGYVKLSFADLLKEGVNLWHGWDERHGWGELKEVVDEYWGYTPRYAYQFIGTDCIRNVHMQNFWVMAAMNKANALLKSGTSVVFADCRFPNEVDAVKQAGGQVVLIDRPSLGKPKKRPDNPLCAYVREKFMGEVFDHASETALLSYDEWDHVIVNDGSLGDLREKVILTATNILQPVFD